MWANTSEEDDIEIERSTVHASLLFHSLGLPDVRARPIHTTQDKSYSGGEENMRIRAVRNPDLKSRHRGNVDGFSLLKLLDILLAGNSHMTTMLNKNKNKKPETRQSPFKARHDAVSGFLVGLDKSSIPNRMNRNSLSEVPC